MSFNVCVKCRDLSGSLMGWVAMSDGSGWSLGINNRNPPFPRTSCFLPNDGLLIRVNHQSSSYLWSKTTLLLTQGFSRLYRSKLTFALAYCGTSMDVFVGWTDFGKK